MKYATLVLLMLLPILLMAQNNRISKSVRATKHELKIKVSGAKDGERISYKNKFIVTGMAQPKRDSIINRVFDSLGVNSKKKDKKN